MRIAINCRSILKPELTGIGRYTHNLLDWLGRAGAGDQYLLYCPKRFLDIKRRRRLPRFPYQNFLVKRDSVGLGPWRSTGGYDVYHLPSPDAVPQNAGAPVVVTVHDMIYKTWPQSQTPEMIAMTEKYLTDIAGRAGKIICVSESTRRDLHRFFDLPEDRSQVVHNGVDHGIFYPLSDGERARALASFAAQGIPDEFMLFVGTLEPRKNLAGVLEALALLKQKKQFSGKLLVAGGGGWMMEDLDARVRKLGIAPQVMFLGHVGDEQLRHLYNLARAFIYPSFYEGFGFPLVEAMACAAAVITSNTSSCVEIAGDAAVTVDPQSPAQMAAAVEKICHDAAFAADLKRRALRRAGDFSFEKTARQTLDVYRGL